MKKLFAVLVLITALCACTIKTPLDDMTPKQVSKLPADEICYWANLGDSVAVPEMHRRKLNCSPEYLYCSNNGFKKGSKAFATCINDYNNAAAKRQAQQLAQQAQYSDTQIREMCYASNWDEPNAFIDCMQKMKYYNANPSAPPIYTPPSQKNMMRLPQTTTCRPGLGNTVECETY